MRSLLRQSVTNYFDHMQDVSWREALFAGHGVPAVLHVCVDVLVGMDTAEIEQVTTFLRDIAIGGTIDDELVVAVRELMPTTVLPALRPLLRAPSFRVRMAAIFTIGKLSFSAEVSALEGVFPLYLERDPFCLPRLMFELSWLRGCDGRGSRVNQIVGHKNYLIRWSALELGCLKSVAPPSQGQDLQQLIQPLEALSADPVALIRNEARQVLTEVEFEIAGWNANWQPKAEWRKRRRELGRSLRSQPIPTFSQLEHRFRNFLSTAGHDDYVLDELAEFVGAIWPITGE